MHRQAIAVDLRFIAQIMCSIRIYYLSSHTIFLSTFCFPSLIIFYSVLLSWWRTACNRERRKKCWLIFQSPRKMGKGKVYSLIKWWCWKNDEAYALKAIHSFSHFIWVFFPSLSFNLLFRTRLKNINGGKCELKGNSTNFVPRDTHTSKCLSIFTKEPILKVCSVLFFLSCVAHAVCCWAKRRWSKNV